MTPTDLRAAFIADLTAVAPDLDPGAIGDSDHLRDDLGLDSMDFMNLVSVLHKRFGLLIPETDYARLATTALAVAYLDQALARSGMSQANSRGLCASADHMDRALRVAHDPAGGAAKEIIL